MANNFRETAVKTIEVDKNRLLKTLKSNLEKHRIDFGEATKEYKKAQILAIAKISEVAAKGRESCKELHESYGEFKDLDCPTNHEDSYEQAIALMQWEERENIELSINDFECYVRDNWDWQRSFKRIAASNSIYLSNR